MPRKKILLESKDLENYLKHAFEKRKVRPLTTRQIVTHYLFGTSLSA